MNYTDQGFYVVGIGASAGGHQALIEFFKNLPPRPDASFVVIMHLSGNHQSQLPQMLSRASSLPVEKIKNGDLIEKNHIYVIPEQVSVVTKDKHFLLTTRTEVRNMTVDSFFESLAEDCMEFAIGIILSGAGSDGSKGVQKIHDNGGKVFVQDPTTALFNSMPRSAINADDPQLIDTPAKLARRITELCTESSQNKR
jgi:two-component system CheB/CheR fusion protein